MVATMRQLRSPQEVIEALGGLKAVAAMTGRSYSSASRWQASAAKFPPSTYVVLQQALVAGGMTAPASLWGMQVPTSKQTEAA